MLDKENSEKLLSNILKRVDDMLPDESGINKLAKQIAMTAAKVSVVALQEYEKLNQQPDSPNSLIQ